MYAAAWPLIGSSAVLLLSPSPPAFEASLRPQDAARLVQVRETNKQRMEELKHKVRR
jgi:hypothetical protein